MRAKSNFLRRLSITMYPINSDPLYGSQNSRNAEKDGFLEEIYQIFEFPDLVSVDFRICTPNLALIRSSHHLTITVVVRRCYLSWILLVHNGK